MVETSIKMCKGQKEGSLCSKKHIYYCKHCGMGGCSREDCTYQGAHYKSGGFFASAGGTCVRCGKMTVEA